MSGRDKARSESAKRYWYYASRRNGDAPASRMPAEELEGFVAKILNDYLGDADRLAGDLHRTGMSPVILAFALDRAKALVAGSEDRIEPLVDLIDRIDLQFDTMTIAIRPAALAGPESGEAKLEPIRIKAPLRMRQAGRARPIVIGGDRRARQPDADLVAMVADARRWMRDLETGAVDSVAEIERREGARKGSVSRILPLAFLAPDIAEAILDGRQPETLTVGALRRLPELPMDWTEQRRLLGFAARTT